MDSMMNIEVLWIDRDPPGSRTLATLRARIGGVIIDGVRILPPFGDLPPRPALPHYRDGGGWAPVLPDGATALAVKCAARDAWKALETRA
jgi:hypothetical protein